FEFAEQDRVVLMGRAGQWLLRGLPHVLRLRVMAPFDRRVKRLAKKLSGQEGRQTNPRTGQDMRPRDDQENARAARYLYEGDRRDPSLYALVINTDKLSIDAGVELVAATLQRPELATTPEAQQLVTDRALASRVQVALATNPETRKYRITVEAKNGLVTRAGTAAMAEPRHVARAAPGVPDA